jgi:glycosyltransferase involved in cell wall biosynthesis
MLFLDVTSACQSNMSTGVQRVVRGIYKSLSSRTAVRPIVWDDKLESYCALDDLELSYLTDPFSVSSTASATPLSYTQRRLWPLLVRQGRSKNRVLTLPNLVGSDDQLFVPEIFEDKRIGFLSRPELAGLRKSAIFYDAIVCFHPQWFQPGRGDNFRRYLRTLGEFHQVCSISHQSARDLRDIWATAGLGETPVLVEPLPAPPHPPSAPWAPNESSRTVLCVGTLEARKNHLGLLEACERIWVKGIDFKLVLIGRKQAHHGPHVLKALQAAKDRQRPVEWRMHTSDDELHDAYLHSRFTVYPSFAEGYGLPIVESLQAGRPCVCGDNGALGEISRQGGCEVVDPSDSESLASGLERLLTDPSHYVRLCQEASIRPFRSWDDYASSLLDFLGIAPSPT